MTPETYTAQPGGCYLMQADGQRVRQDDAPAPPAVPVAPVPDAAPTPAATAKPAAPKPASKE